ncbi:MAG: EAL domain-containing protein [Actinomycetota bacterium]|nr:EAL domain-containing protein [Actinomycetota bacterium]
MDAQTTNAEMTHLRGLLDVTRLVAEASDLSEVLDAVAHTIAGSLGFQTVAINLYRPAWDDFSVTTVYGNDAARSSLLGTTNPTEVWQPLLDERFLRRGAYVIRAGQLDWDELDLPRYVPPPGGSVAQGSDAWTPEDSLMVTLKSSSRELLGIISVDEPVHGRCPTDEELDVLVSLARHAAVAIARHRAALVSLLDVSRKLTRATSTKEVLDSICSAIGTTLGFEKVAIKLLDPKDGNIRISAAHGWTTTDPAVSSAYPLKDIAALLDPSFEEEGTYLIPHDEVVARVDPSRIRYESVRNGRGPRAWDRHWLLAPLNSGGQVIGLVRVDDPEDLLQPSLERRQELRMFADQAALSLDNAAQREHLRASQARFRSLVHSSSDLVMVVGASLDLKYASPATSETFDLDPDREVVGIMDLAHADDAGHLKRFLDDHLASASGGRIEWRARRPDGSYVYLETLADRLVDESSLGELLLTSRDVTERKELETRLTHQALHDPLTGLGNTTLFTSALDRALHRSEDASHQVAVLFIDMDNFKAVNDSFGHEAGDQFLAETARRLTTCLRPTDSAARVGGDEFAVMIESCSIGAAEAVAARMQRVLRTPVLLCGRTFDTSASIGIVVGSSSIDSPQDLIGRADAAMYAAKAQGKGRSVVFGTTEHLAVVERQRLKLEARAAIDRGEFRVHYQPIVDLSTGNLAGFEALARWQHPEKGLLPPESFIPLMEDSGSIVPLGEWVLEEACRSLSEWVERHPRLADLHVNVNLSARQLLDDGLVDRIREILATHSVTPSQLVIEFTESVLLEDSPGTVERLHALRALGIQLAIDDFGTGYSSLSYLRNFPVDILKIEKQFVQGASEGVEDAALAKAIVYLGNSLGLKTVAEGIETRRHLESIAQLRCDEGQGFFFGEPADKLAFESLFLSDAALEDESAPGSAPLGAASL